MEASVQSRNPYSTPKATVSGAQTEFGEIKILSARGRLGRVRYIGYSIGLTLLVAMLVGGLGGGLATAVGPGVAMAVAGIGYIFMFVVMFLLTIQRAHDFNTTGWLSLLSLIPLVNFIFWFVPGTEGENRFGKQTPPNSVGAMLLASILPLIFVVGIVAAIALPAYQDYVKRAAEASGQQTQ
ncbi:MAG: DUF805 domain-containing protein [Burkholderiales bacterium]